MKNLAAIQALLALPIESGIQEELKSRDEAGWTPVEACEREIRSDREFSETLPPKPLGGEQARCPAGPLFFGEGCGGRHSSYARAICQGPPVGVRLRAMHRRVAFSPDAVSSEV